MANRDGRVFPQEKLRHRFADNVAAPDDDGVFARDWNIRTLQNLDNSGGRARDERFLPLRKLADIDRMKTVNVLFGIYRFENLALVNLRRERKLHQNSVNFFTVV